MEYINEFVEYLEVIKKCSDYTIDNYNPFEIEESYLTYKDIDEKITFKSTDKIYAVDF